MPVEPAQRATRLSGRPGETALDAFAGCNTALIMVACQLAWTHGGCQTSASAYFDWAARQLDRGCVGLRMNSMTASALSQARWRQSAAHALERQLWSDWERALRELQTKADRLERGRSRWKARLARAMRGVDPDVWWRINDRVEAGELWIAHGSQARRAQRVVYVSRPTVLALTARRAVDLHELTAAMTAAENRLREASLSAVGRCQLGPGDHRARRRSDRPRQYDRPRTDPTRHPLRLCRGLRA